jgi:hypothetical protein
MNLSKTGSLKVSSDGVVLTDKDAVASRSGVLSEIRRVYNLRSFTRNDRKRLIVDYGDPSGDDAAAPISSSIYDAKTDPHEISDISDDQLSKELKLELDSLLSRAKESTIESDDATLSDETIEQLRSLGYLK